MLVDKISEIIEKNVQDVQLVSSTLFGLVSTPVTSNNELAVINFTIIYSATFIEIFLFSIFRQK